MNDLKLVDGFTDKIVAKFLKVSSSVLNCVRPVLLSEMLARRYQKLGDLVSKETVCCVGGKVKL